MRKSLFLLSSTLAAVLLAGCAGSGGGTTPSALGQPGGSGATQSVGGATTQSIGAQNLAAPDKSGGVTVKPDKVDLTLSNPTQSVTVSGPKGSTISEKDNCTSKGVATITLSGTDTYEVTAGLTSGSCHAKFIAKGANGKKVGSGRLQVKNTV